MPRAPGRPGRHPGAARSQAARQTDRIDARHLRELLGAGTLPESWMPPAHIADARTQVRLRRALVGERTGWQQRIHAILFHHGLPERSQLLTADGRAWLARAELPAVARQAVEGALGMIDQLEVELDRLDGELAGIARVQPGCQALQRRDGVGWLTAVAIWAEFGEVRRFANSRQAVRFCGLDITPSPTASAPAATWPARAPGAGLGVARGGHVRRPPHLPRPPLLPPGQTAPGWQAGRAVGGLHSWPARPTTPCASSATRRWSPPNSQPPPEQGWHRARRAHRSADVVWPAP